MTIKELYSTVRGLPKNINIIDDNDKHPWMGKYENAPEEYKEMRFKSAYIHKEPIQLVIYL